MAAEPQPQDDATKEPTSCRASQPASRPLRQSPIHPRALRVCASSASKPSANPAQGRGINSQLARKPADQPPHRASHGQLRLGVPQTPRGDCRYSSRVVAPAGPSRDSRASGHCRVASTAEVAVAHSPVDADLGGARPAPAAVPVIFTAAPAARAQEGVSRSDWTRKAAPGSERLPATAPAAAAARRPTLGAEPPPSQGQVQQPDAETEPRPELPEEGLLRMPNLFGLRPPLTAEHSRRIRRASRWSH